MSNRRPGEDDDDIATAWVEIERQAMEQAKMVIRSEIVKAKHGKPWLLPTIVADFHIQFRVDGVDVNSPFNGRPR